MRQLRVLLLFIFVFLLGGGTAYAQSADDGASDPSSTRQETVAIATETKIETSRANDTVAEGEASDPIQEPPIATEEEKQEPEAVETPEADQAKATETETVEEEKQVVSDEQEDIDGEKPANDSTEEAVLPVEADQEEAEQPEEAKADEAEASRKGEVLEKGTVLDPQALVAKEPGAEETDANRVEVESFGELKEALENAKDGVETTIVVTTSIEIKATLTIGERKKIILTSYDGKKMDDPWEKIKQPKDKDYADQGEKEQRKVIEEGRNRGEAAISDADTHIIKEGDEYYYDFEHNVVLKRWDYFSGSLFEVKGSLTLGDAKNSINFDGNKKKVTADVRDNGSFFNVNGGRLVLKNGVIANGKGEAGYSAPVKVKKGGTFIMEGGRITFNYTHVDNDNIAFGAGAVYVEPSGTFTLKNGMLDHNTGITGAVYVGDILNGAGNGANLLEKSDQAAKFNMEGGLIVSNKAIGYTSPPGSITIDGKTYTEKDKRETYLAGGVSVVKAGTMNFKDGIIANNTTKNSGAGIFVLDGYIYNYFNVLGNEYALLDSKSYDEYRKVNKAEVNVNGGLIYKNAADYAGGAIYIGSNDVNIEKTMILNNTAKLWGGGIYVSFPPVTQKLKGFLVSDNSAKETDRTLGEDVDKEFHGPGNGGGIWNCPSGYVHIGDGHSVYVFDNTATGKGDDLTFTKKTGSFNFRQDGNDEQIKDKFYSHVSPITEGKNIIKFINDNGDEEVVIPDKMSYTNDWVHLRAVYSDFLRKEAWEKAGVFILGNSARYGGGIGSNANLETPDDEGDVDFKFKKKWHEDIEEKEYKDKDLHIDIFIVPKDVDDVYVRSQYKYDNNLYKYGEVILNKENGWEARFSAWKKGIYNDLPVAKDNGLPFTNKELSDRGFKYLVVERETGYATNVEQKEMTETKADGSSTKVLVYEFTIHNSPYAEAKIKKIWIMLTEEELRQALGDNKNIEVKSREIPNQVTFYVLKDGKRIAIDYKRDENGKVYPIYKTVTLTKAEGWEGVIAKLDPILLEKGAYGIEEETLEGFKASYEFKKVAKDSGYEFSFLVTNQELPPETPPEEPEEPPKTPPEEPEEPPKTPPEEPEEPPVMPPEEPEEPPVIPPKKPGGPPQTGVGSVAPYMMLALSSSLGLGYIRRKKH